MSDKKTKLRELGVLYWIDNITSNVDNNTVRIAVNNFIDKIYKITSQKLDITGFDDQDYVIIENSKNIAISLIDKLKIVKPVKLQWLGEFRSLDNPVDILVNDIPVSLKENSYILENMGLYKLINLLTGENIKRGSNIFKMFSPNEYEKWFETTWNLLIKEVGSTSNVLWSKTEKDYSSKIILDRKDIVFSFRLNSTSYESRLPSTNISLNQFEKLTNHFTREKVFSKWIKETLSNNDMYKESKRTCAVVAGVNLEKYINSKINIDNLARLFQIYKKSYFYVNFNNGKPTVYRVPSINEFKEEYLIDAISPSVPATQLNLITKIKNKQTGVQLELRNELRFSHGQFNGVPEAKLYYSRSSNLSSIYFPL